MTVLTVTLNAAIDKRYDVSSVEIGAVQRVRRVQASAGGKGLNAARGAQLCGQQVIATGFVAGFAGEFVTSRIAAAGMWDEFVRVSGETRTCINIIDDQGRSTEFLEPGVAVTPDDLAALVTRFSALLEQVAVVTLSGSAPSGCPDDVYARLVESARRAGRPVILDASGELLRSGLAAGPTIAKPNRDELAVLVGRSLDDLDAVVAAAREVRRDGPEWVVVSLGAEGVLAVGERTLRVDGLRVEAVNPVGCGDVLVGALAAALATGLAMDEALALAVSASAAAAAHPETGCFDPELAASLRPTVTLTELEDPS